MKKTISRFACGFAFAISTAFIFFSGNTFAAETHYPLTMNNCGRTLVFKKRPESAVSVGQNSTEILYALGLGDKIKGTALWYSDVLPQFADINRNIKILSMNEPSFESIIKERPDMVANHLEWSIGPQGSVASYEQFDDLGIPVYTAPADCTAKDNEAGGDGLRAQPFSMDMIYQEISELAEIFDVQEQGKALINELKAREEAAKAKVADIAKNRLSAVFWYSSADMEMDPYVAGQKGAPAYIMNILGIRNIIDSDHEWPTIGWETIVKENPSIVVMADMQRRRFPADDIKVKYEFLKTDPVTKLMAAVEKNHLVTLDAQAMNPTMRTVDGIEALADAIVKMGILNQ